jgi:hypothetical protein
MESEHASENVRAKPIMFVQTAALIASCADELAEMIRMLIGRKRLPRRFPAGPALEEWLRFYRGHRRLMNALGRAALGDVGASATELWDGWRKLIRMPQEQLEAEIREAVEEFPEVMKQLAKVLVGVVEFPADEENTRAVLKEVETAVANDAGEGGPIDVLMHSAEGQFWFRVQVWGQSLISD